jgi:hypothetical protein
VTSAFIAFGPLAFGYPHKREDHPMPSKKNPPANESPRPAEAPPNPPTSIRRTPSEARLRANRLNVQKSTGPRTEEGKQRASLNATRHGLTGQVLTLTAEGMNALQVLIGDFEKQYSPANAQEKHLAHMLAQLQYRLHRIMATEHNLFAIGLTENSDLWDLNHPEAQTAFVLAETLRRSKDPLLTLSIYEQRLMRQYDKVLKMLREVQAERKAQETREQEAIYEVGMCHLAAGKEFSPAEFGFVCSSAEAESLVKRKWTLEHANNAHTWNFDRESCGPALAFAA